MSKLNFMQRLSQTLTKMGSGLTQTAMTGIALKSMNNCCGGQSIFGFGCGSFGYGGGMGITPQMMADPMGFLWLVTCCCRKTAGCRKFSHDTSITATNKD